MRFAKSGHRVLYIRVSAFEELPIEDEDPIQINNYNLRNIYFRYLQTPSEVSKLLLELYSWSMKPKLVIVDFLHTFFMNSSFLSISEENLLMESRNQIESEKEFIREHLLITASLHNAINLLAETDSKCFSILCVNTRFHPIYQRFVQAYVDLYYYKEKVIFSNSCNLANAFKDFI